MTLNFKRQIQQWRESGAITMETSLLLTAASVNYADKVNNWAGLILTCGMDWDELLEQAAQNGLSPLLWRFLDQLGPEIVPADIVEETRGQVRSNALHNLKMTGELDALLKTFAHNRITAIPYKGPSLAVLAYGDLLWREFGDLDVLITCGDLQRAGALMQDHGYKPEFAPSQTRGSAFLKASNALSFRHPVKGVLVELHWQLSPQMFPFEVGTNTLRKNLQIVSISGKQIRTFSNELLLVYLCSHGTRHRWTSLGWVADVAWLVDQWQIDWDKAFKLARRTKSLRMLRLGLLLAIGLFGAEIPSAVEAQLEKDAVVRKLALQVCEWLFNLGGSSSEVIKRSLFYLQLHESAGAKAAYLWRLIATPNIADWQFCSLPNALTFLYPLIRPIRLIAEHLPFSPLQKPSH